jgi:glycosyltransferase involved in cell wall biosynthesis
MSNSSVNVVIVTYNQETLIKDTLDSVLNQSYDNITKIVVADDGSTDETPNIIKQYALDNPVIEPVLAKENKGITYNMNRALKHADADYISFMDGDDQMFPQKIEKQVNVLDANPDLVGCAHDMDVFDSSKGKKLGKFSEVVSFKNKIAERIGIESFFDPSTLLCPSSAMYRSEKLPVNGYDNRLKYWSEFLFAVELVMKGDIGIMDEVLGLYNLHGSNASLSMDMKESGLENALIVYSIILSRYPELYSLVKRRRTATYLANIVECVKDGNNKKAKNLSKILISEGSYFKGLGAYLFSSIFNKERADKLYQNKRLLKFFVKHV